MKSVNKQPTASTFLEVLRHLLMAHSRNSALQCADTASAAYGKLYVMQDKQYVFHYLFTKVELRNITSSLSVRILSELRLFNKALMLATYLPDSFLPPPSPAGFSHLSAHQKLIKIQTAGPCEITFLTSSLLVLYCWHGDPTENHQI